MRSIQIIAALLCIGSAQARPVYSGNPDLTPEQRAQLEDTYRRSTQPPRLISNSLQDAVGKILSENGSIDGLIGPLPSELAAAVERAAIRTPVTLIVASDGAGLAFSRRVKLKRVNLTAGSSIIALNQSGLLIFFQSGQLQVIDAKLQAASTHQTVLTMYNQLP